VRVSAACSGPERNPTTPPCEGDLQAGFSTAETVTNLSGRGVGLDVLNTAMKELRGRISIDSKAGQGAKVVLAIPLTLAFLDSW